MTSTTTFPLEGDGIIENLYHYLWQKDELNCGPEGIKLPDTVVYRYYQPYFWYFTSKDGSLKRKNKASVTNAKIEEAFLSKKATGSDVVAFYIANDAYSKGNRVAFLAELD